MTQEAVALRDADDTANLRERCAEQEKAIDHLEKKADELACEVSRLEDELDLASEDGGVSEHVEELARIRTLLKSGKHDEGRERLERVLNDLDPCWRVFA